MNLFKGRPAGMFGPSSAVGTLDLTRDRRPDSINLPAKPPLQSVKLSPSAVEPTRQQQLDEYAELAQAVGVLSPDLSIKSFEAFLVEHDIPVFSLSAVITYMDEKAANESKDRCGWEWLALREKDQRIGVSFGRQAARHWGNDGVPVISQAASDYYSGGKKRSDIPVSPQQQLYMQQMNFIADQVVGANRIYDKTIPLHALRKVAAIDKAFGGRVAMLVCDYALAPHIQNPDPFLMAMIENPKLENGTGRFIIDFWDEPGFGIEQQLR